MKLINRSCWPNQIKSPYLKCEGSNYKPRISTNYDVGCGFMQYCEF